MKKSIIYIAAILFLSTSVFAGGPWPQPKGVGYFKLSEWWTSFDQHFTDEGLLDPNSTTGIYNTAFYGEYGISNRVTLIANANLFSRNVINNQVSGTNGSIIIPGDSYNGLGDIDLGIKYGLTAPGSKYPVAITATFGLPTGATNEGALGNLATGDGEFNQMIQLDAGTGFKLGGLNAYASAYGGFNHRTNGFSEEIRFGAELGVGLLDSKLWLATKLNVVESLQNGDTAETTTSTSIFANNTEYSSFALEANYYVTKRVGVSANVAGAFTGAIIAAAPSYSVGIFYDMGK